MNQNVGQQKISGLNHKGKKDAKQREKKVEIYGTLKNIVYKYIAVVSERGEKEWAKAIFEEIFPKLMKKLQATGTRNPMNLMMDKYK